MVQTTSAIRDRTVAESDSAKLEQEFYTLQTCAYKSNDDLEGRKKARNKKEGRKEWVHQHAEI